MEKAIEHKRLDLSPTQFRVCIRTANGEGAKQVGDAMFISTHTVQTHLKRIRKKNGLKNVAELVKEFILGLDDPMKTLSTERAKRIASVILILIQMSTVFNGSDYDVRKKTRVSKANKKAKKEADNEFETWDYFF